MLRPLLALVLSSLVPLPGFAEEQVREWRIAQADETPGQAESSDVASEAIYALRRGEFEKAIELTTKVIDSGDLEEDDIINAYILRADAYAAMGRTEEAISDVSSTLQLRPDDPSLVNLRGDIHLNSGEFPAALQDYDRSIELKPDFWEAYIDRGFTHAMLEDFNKAVADATKAVDISPNEFTFANRGDLYLAQDQFDLAIQDFSDALSQGEITNIGAYLGRAEAYFSSERYDDALADYDKADEMSPDDAVVLFLRGTTHEELGNFAKARADLERAGELDPEYTDVQDALERLESK